MIENNKICQEINYEQVIKKSYIMSFSMINRNG